MTAAQRYSALQNDPWAHTIEPAHVQCRGCMNWISLRNDPKHPYELNNWQAHSRKCAQITGQLNKWIKVIAAAPSASAVGNRYNILSLDTHPQSVFKRDPPFLLRNQKGQYRFSHG